MIACARSRATSIVVLKREKSLNLRSRFTEDSNAYHMPQAILQFVMLEVFIAVITCRSS
jgi:hypothetical protein